MSQEERLNLLVMNLLNINLLENMFMLSRIWENITIETLIRGLQRFFFQSPFHKRKINLK